MLEDNSETYNQTLADARYYNSVEEITRDVDADLLQTHDLVCLRHPNGIYLATAGRIMFNNLFEGGFTNKPFSNTLGIAGVNTARFNDLKYDGLITAGKNGRGKLQHYGLSKICLELYKLQGSECIEAYQNFSEFGFKMCDKFGVTLSLLDLDLKSNKEQLLKEADAKKTLIEDDFQCGLISAEDKKNAVTALYVDSSIGVCEKIKKDMISQIPRNNNIFIMMDSGARGNETQVMHMCGVIGSLQKTKTENLEDPVTSNYFEGLDAFDVQMTSFSSRIGVASTQNETRTAGYITHQAVYMNSGTEVVATDCGKSNWWYDVIWAGLKTKSCKFMPSEQWFNDNLAGHVIDASDVKAIKDFGVGPDRVITKECRNNLIMLGGFSTLKLEDSDSAIEVELSMLLRTTLAPGESDCALVLNRLLDRDMINQKCLNAILKHHLKTVNTSAGCFYLRYKMDDMSRSLLLHREAKGLKHLYAMKSASVGEVYLTTEETLDSIEDDGLDRVPVRVLLDCECTNGICAKCFGLKYSNLQFPEVGEFVGTEAAQAISEPASQMTLSLINKGGASGESVASGVQIFGKLLDGNVGNAGAKDVALVAPTSGYVRVSKLDKTVSVCIEPESTNCAICRKCKSDNGLVENADGTIVCPNTNRLLSFRDDQAPACLFPKRINGNLLIPKDGEYIYAGDQLTLDPMTASQDGTYSLVQPDQITNVRGDFSPVIVLRKKQITWLLNYYNTFKSNNISINARNFELLTRVQNLYVTVMYSEDPEFEVGSVYEFNEVMGNDKVSFSMKVSKQSDVILRNSGAFTALSFENIAEVAAKITTSGFKSYFNKNNSLIGSVAIGADMCSNTMKSFKAPRILQRRDTDVHEKVTEHERFISDAEFKELGDVTASGKQVEINEDALAALSAFSLGASKKVQPTPAPLTAPLTVDAKDDAKALDAITAFSPVQPAVNVAEELTAFSTAPAQAPAPAPAPAQAPAVQAMNSFSMEASVEDDDEVVEETSSFEYDSSDYMYDDEDDEDDNSNDSNSISSGIADDDDDLDNSDDSNDSNSENGLMSISLF